MKDLLLVLLQVHLVFTWHQVALPALSELVYEVVVPWKKSISDKDPGISQMIPGHCLIYLSCDITALGNLRFALFPISKWCLCSLHSLLQIAACGRRYLQYSSFYPQSTSHMFEMGKRNGAVAGIRHLWKEVALLELNLLLPMFFSPLGCQENLPLVDAAYLTS